MTDWQPIATAPKDGRRILGFGRLSWDDPGMLSIGTVRWDATYNRWEIDPNENTEYDADTCDLTHWMPLPAPPSAQSR